MFRKILPAFILFSFMVCVLITVIGVCIKDNMVEIGPETSTRTFTIETTTTTEETTSTTITTSTTETTTETTTSTSTTELTTTTTTAPDIQNTSSPLYATYFEDAHLSQTEAIQVVVPATILTYSPRPQTTCATTTIQMKTEPPHVEIVEVAQTTQTEAITNANWHFIGTFKGTYYLPASERGQRPGNTCGGSGRLLEDCGRDNEYGIRGSVACKRIWTEYGYELNGKTIILIQSQSMPALNGYYYVDDCCASMNVVDFYFDYASNCPFSEQGVVYDISVSVMP